jgi:hypothetical protein
MDISVIRKAVQKLPSRPFVLTMNDGREFEIFYPDWIFVESGHVTIMDEGNRRAIHLEPILIASLSVDDTPEAVADMSLNDDPKLGSPDL